MTESLQDLERRIESATELHTITRTMRSLAAVNVRHHELAAGAAAEYERIIEDGLQVVLRDGGFERLPSGEVAASAPTAIVVFGSNQGLCGPVNRHVVAHAVVEAQRWPSLAVVGAVGDRLAAELEVVGLVPASRWDLPSTVERIAPRAEQVLLRADEWRAEHGVERIRLVFPSYVSRARGYDPVTAQLAPTDRDWLRRLSTRAWRSPVLPTYTIAWDRLFPELIREAMLVNLHRTFAQTMVSVAASRLTAMDAAQQDIEQRLARMRSRHQQLRQSEITEELIDVVSGFEVLTSERGAEVSDG